jgi:hypothetical protein
MLGRKTSGLKTNTKKVVKTYSKEELGKHAQLLAITVKALEESEKDFLGEIFMERVRMASIMQISGSNNDKSVSIT